MRKKLAQSQFTGDTNQHESTKVGNPNGQLPNHERIIAVAIDMWEPYRIAVQRSLPDALVVVDAFHLIQASTRALDEVRKKAQKGLDHKQSLALKQDKELFTTPIEDLRPEERERLEHWHAQVPELAQAFLLHQKLRGLYRCSTFEDALDHLVLWEREVLESGLEPILKLHGTVWKWLPEIMNRFICKISNAKTEGKNNQLRAMNKQGFGYKIRSLRARMQMKEQQDALIGWRNYQQRLERRQHDRQQAAS
ncbi:MAG: transposase [Alicyclobacillus sp.]|nr:transposase [Alicyclobacillus sp.]